MTRRPRGCVLFALSLGGGLLASHGAASGQYTQAAFGVIAVLAAFVIISHQ